MHAVVQVEAAQRGVGAVVGAAEEGGARGPAAAHAPVTRHTFKKWDYKRDWLWVRSPLEEIKYTFKFIFSFLRSGVEAKRGVEFR